jgi:hypothetical protein
VKDPDIEKLDKLKPWELRLYVPILTVLVLAALYVVASWLFPVRHGSEPAKNAESLWKVKQHALSLAMYCADHDDTLPRAEQWVDLSMPYSKNEEFYIDPLLVDRKPGEFGYAFFLPMSEVETAKVEQPDKMPMTFQSSDLSRNANGYLDLLPYRMQKRRTNIVSFIDSHAKSMPESWRFEVIVIELPEK